MGMTRENHSGSGKGLRSLFARKQTSFSLAVRLEFKGKIIHEISDIPSSDVITIGRSSDCVWAIPKEDSVASGHHAVILMRKGKFCLRDTGSRNGIFFRGRKIQEKNLEPDDQFTIGGCTLFVEKVVHSSVSRHELVFLNTDRKGVSFRLDKPKVMAGSAPGCDLRIEEQLVSQKHAEFNTKADGCWLKDLGSKNGTFVNGTKLSSGTERLLADDDVVTLAFVDMKFVDGRVEHSKIRIWSSLLIIAATIFIVLALNWFWMSLKESSDSCLASARREAAAERFVRAGELLKESRTRRGAESNEIAYNELAQSIAVWEKIHSGWQRAQGLLSSGSWIEASHVLGGITDPNPNIWGWNDTSALEKRKEAFASKKLLDAFLFAETSMRDDLNQKNLAELKRAVDVIRNSEKLFGRKPPLWLKKLLEDSIQMREQIDRNLMMLDKLESILARIESESDNLTMVMNDLEDLKKNAEPNIRLRIENCMVPLAMLQRSGKQIKFGILAVQQLNFDSLNQIKLDLPSLEQCAVNASIAILRKNHERRFQAVLSTASYLKPLILNLKRNGLTADSSLPECVSSFENETVMKKVFACDVLDRRMPSRLRTEPSGEYDRLLGTEGFFEFIYSLPAPYDSSVYADFHFRPEIVKFRELMGAVRAFCAFAEQGRNRWLHSGSFHKLYEKNEEIVKHRDALVARFRSGKYSDPRSSVLGKAIAAFLAENSLGETEMNALILEFKKLRLPLIRLGRAYNTASDEKKIEIRDTILRGGIPGDPVVRRMWGFKKYPR